MRLQHNRNYPHILVYGPDGELPRGSIRVLIMECRGCGELARIQVKPGGTNLLEVALAGESFVAKHKFHHEGGILHGGRN